MAYWSVNSDLPLKQVTPAIAAFVGCLFLYNLKVQLKPPIIFLVFSVLSVPAFLFASIFGPMENEWIASTVMGFAMSVVATWIWLKYRSGVGTG